MSKSLSEKIFEELFNEGKMNYETLFASVDSRTLNRIYRTVRYQLDRVHKLGRGLPTDEKKAEHRQWCDRMIEGLHEGIEKNPDSNKWTVDNMMDLRVYLVKSADACKAMCGAAQEPAPQAPVVFSRTRRDTLQQLKRLLRTTTDAQLRSLGLVRRRPRARPLSPRASMPCTPTPSAIATGVQVQVDGAVPVGVSIGKGACTTHLRTLHGVQAVKELLRRCNPDDEVARRIAVCTSLFFMGFSSRKLLTCTWPELEALIRTGTLPQDSAPGGYRAEQVGREILELLGVVVQKQLGREGLVAASPKDSSKPVDVSLMYKQCSKRLAMFAPLKHLDDIRRC